MNVMLRTLAATAIFSVFTTVTPAHAWTLTDGLYGWNCNIQSHNVCKNGGSVGCRANTGHTSYNASCQLFATRDAIKAVCNARGQIVQQSCLLADEYKGTVR